MGSCQGSHIEDHYEDEQDDVDPGKDVFIYLDDAEDEVDLDAVGSDYAPAEPPMRRDIRPPVEWYDPDEDEYKAEQDMYSSCFSLPGRHNQEHLALAELFQIVDEHAMAARYEDAESYSELIDYLKKPIRNDKYTEVLLVRALISWLASQKIDKDTDNDSATTETPNGYLQLQKQRKATFASVFTTLCRHAGIQCAMIHGVCKAGNYQPGDTELETCTWAAVNLQGDWHFVHPYWVCRVMIGNSETGWIRLESDMKPRDGSSSRSKDRIIASFRETYFLPKPEDFKYVCYPDDSEWQLLPPETRVKSKQEFLKLPFRLPCFFGTNLSLISTHCCELETKTGYIDIVFKCHKNKAFKTLMTYDLYVRDVPGNNNEMLMSGNLARLVLNTRCEEKFSFQIRFPEEGVYKIVFYAGHYGMPMVRVSEFKLTCLQSLPTCQLLPIKVGIEGWGPGPISERNGLVLSSHQSGVVHLKAPPKNVSERDKNHDNTAHIKFAIDQDKVNTIDYSVEMNVGDENIMNADNDKNCSLQYEVDRQKNELNVEATVEKAGEFALTINASKKGGRKRSVCNYLLTTLQNIREGVPQRKARKALKRALSEESNLDELTDLIEKCHKAKLTENDDDIRAAKNQRTFLLVKQHLLDCVKRRNIDFMDRSLKIVSKYRHKLALILETRRAEKLKMQLENLGGYTQDVPKLNKACEELVYLAKPKPEVPGTMKALFMLLKEPIDTRLDDWGYLQSRLKLAKDHKNNVLNRMKRVSEQEIDAKSRRKIQTQLYKYTEAEVRQASQAAASFYIWTDGVLNALGGTTCGKASEKQEENTLNTQ